MKLLFDFFMSLGRRCLAVSNSAKARQIVTVPGKVVACPILPQPSFGDPRGLDRLESIDQRSLRGGPLWLGSGDGPIEKSGGGRRRRHRSVDSNRSIGDPLGEIPLGGSPEGSAAVGGANGPIEKFGGGRRRHRSVDSNRSIGDPLGGIP